MCTQQPLVEAPPRHNVLGLAYMLRDTINAFIAMEEARIASKTEQLVPLVQQINESVQRHLADSAPKPSGGPQEPLGADLSAHDLTE